MDEFQVGFRVVEGLGLATLGYVAIGIAQLKHAVFGPKGDNGMYGDIKELKEWRGEHDLFHAGQTSEGPT